MRTVVLLNVQDIADLLCVNDETVRKWIKEEKLKTLPARSKKEGYEILYEDFEDFINNNYKYHKRYITSLAAKLVHNRNL